MKYGTKRKTTFKDIEDYVFSKLPTLRYRNDVQLVVYNKRTKRMKSIKEKAEEYSRCIASSEYTREDFVSGANYVLEQIEKELPSKDNRSLNDYGKALVWRLKDCIEQLKK